MINFSQPKTVIEPFRIKCVEPLPLLSAAEREAAIRKAHYNLFALPAQAVTFDFLTDSGTSAMSANQWAAMMVGDESYAGAKSFQSFERKVRELTGYEHVIPTHQGRAAEALLFKVMVKPGQVVIGNTHFDTTRANIEAVGACALDFPDQSNGDSRHEAPFKGNIDLERLRSYLAEHHPKVALLIMTVTNNSVGGQPVSIGNLRAARELCTHYGVPLFIDAARFAENAYFIRQREDSFRGKSIREITHALFGLADGALMSAKKDAFGNIGGFLALHSTELADQVRTQMVLTEGFPTYGGLAGRDLEALSVGLDEIVEESFLRYRIRSTAYLGEGLEAAGFEMVKPYGGHAVYIDAAATLPHIPALQYPGQSLAVILYEAIGVRSVEIGSVMLGRRDAHSGQEFPAPKELVRLAIPRRVYTQSHVDYIIELAAQLRVHLAELRGYAFNYQAAFLRHFTAKFRKL